MKYLRGLAVVFVIFVLPAGSWYYLQSGYNYRVGALQELEPKGQLIPLAKEKETKDLITDKVTLICLCEGVSDEDMTTLKNIEEKYDSRGFQVIRLAQSDADYQSLKNKYGPDPLILIDIKRQLRNTYTLSPDDIKEVVKHIAIVIPMPSRQKIKLKREG